MGRIYSEAELVIIAAAGDSSDYGLPGVGMKARKVQKIIQPENDVEIIEMNEPDQELSTVTWAQRGWTHQEGYLATRRLVFTDKEVLYVCNQGAWQESVQRPAMENGGHYLTMANQCFPRTAIFPYNRLSTVHAFLTNYSGRKLSYDSDILNACIGVLNKLVNHYHFWGMAAPRLGAERSTSLSLEWYSWNPGQRREDFPSWSWVATTGPKSISGCRERPHEGYVACIRTTHERWLPPHEQTESRCDPLPMNFGPTLRLRAPLYTASLSTDVKYEKRKDCGKASDNRPLVIFQSTDGDYNEIEVVSRLCLDTELTESEMKTTVRAVLVAGSTREDRDMATYSDDNPVFMILQTVGGHHKRIGITDHGDGGCWMLEKRTGAVRVKDDDTILLYDDCRGSEQFIYIE
jgi:hypothetical protein